MPDSDRLWLAYCARCGIDDDTRVYGLMVLAAAREEGARAAADKPGE